MKRKWTQIIVRILPVAVAAALIFEEFENLNGRKWG
jgi:hypothetical protein